MRPHLLFLAVLATLTVIATAFVGAAAGTSTALPNGAAASVNGEVIETSLLEGLVAAQETQPQFTELEDPAQRASLLEQTQRQALTGLVQRTLLFQAAADIGVEVTDAEFDEQWEGLEVQYGGAEGLAKAIVEAGQTVENVKLDVRADVMQRNIQAHFADESSVDDAALQALYDERLATQFQTRTAAHILVEDEAEANAIMGLLADGADFAELAKEKSIDTASGLNGGDLGAAAVGAYVTEFDAAVWESEIGALVGPIETQFGFHIIRIDSEETTPFSEAAEALRLELASQTSQAELTEWFSTFRDAAVIVIDPRFGTFNSTTGEITATDPLAE